MNDSGLINLLKSFSENELDELSGFLSLNYINNRLAVSKLFTELRHYHPSYSISAEERNKIFKKIFPGKRFNENTFKVLNHYLFELAKKFIAARRFDSETFQNEYYKLLELSAHGQYRTAGKVLKNLVADKKKNPKVYESEFLEKFFIESYKMNLLLELNDGIYEKIINDIDLYSAFNNLTSFYYLKTFKIYLNILNINLLYKSGFETSDFENVFKEVDESKLTAPLLKLYYHLIRLFKGNDDEKSFFIAKDIFFRIKGSMLTDELVEVYINLENYSNRKVLSGIKKFEKERFELYREQLNDGSYKADGRMSPVYYKNLVSFGLLLNETKWVESFINTYRKELPREIEKDLFSLCRSLLEFHKHHFETALDLLSKVRFKDVYWNMDSKSLQIMIYYELHYEESMISAIEAFRHFLRNNKLVTENKKVSFVNFIRYLNKFILLKRKSDTPGLQILKDKIVSEKTIAYKAWLSDKISNFDY